MVSNGASTWCMKNVPKVWGLIVHTTLVEDKVRRSFSPKSYQVFTIICPTALYKYVHSEVQQGATPLNSEKFTRWAVYHNLYVLKVFLKNKDLRPIHLMNCVKMVQYHILDFQLLSIFDTLGPEKVALHVIQFQALGLFPKWMLFSVRIHVTRWASGLSTSTLTP